MPKRRDADEESRAARFTWQEGDVEIIATGPKYPHVTVQLVGRDSNAFNLIGLVVRALRDASVPQPEIDAFIAEATAGDHDHLLRTIMDWAEVS